MNQRQQDELELAGRFLRAIGCSPAYMEPGDRPDVVALINGKRIGIELTEFHPDEEQNVPGSRLRAEGEKIARNSTERVFAQWAPADPMPGLLARLRAKIDVAAAYDDKFYDELWLLVSAQVPKCGAVAATYAFVPFIDVPGLNQSTDELLRKSVFSAAYLHLLFSRLVYAWTPTEQWHQIPAAN
jgi:hypothetical protein